MNVELILLNYYRRPFTDTNLWTAARERLWLRYLIARYSAFDNLFLWTLANEYETHPGRAISPRSAGRCGVGESHGAIHQGNDPIGTWSPCIPSFLRARAGPRPAARSDRRGASAASSVKATRSTCSPSRLRRLTARMGPTRTAVGAHLRGRLDAPWFDTRGTSNSIAGLATCRARAGASLPTGFTANRCSTPSSATSICAAIPTRTGRCITRTKCGAPRGGSSAPVVISPPASTARSATVMSGTGSIQPITTRSTSGTRAPQPSWSAPRFLHRPAVLANAALDGVASAPKWRWLSRANLCGLSAPRRNGDFEPQCGEGALDGTVDQSARGKSAAPFVITAKKAEAFQAPDAQDWVLMPAERQEQTIRKPIWLSCCSKTGRILQPGRLDFVVGRGLEQNDVPRGAILHLNPPKESQPMKKLCFVCLLHSLFTTGIGLAAGDSRARASPCARAAG